MNVTKKDFDEFVDSMFTNDEHESKGQVFFNGKDLKKIRESQGDKFLHTILRRFGLITNDEGLTFVESFLEEIGESIDGFDVIKQERFIEPNEVIDGVLDFIKKNNPDED